MLELFFVCLQFSLIFTTPVRNNVCKSFADYATIENNKNCYYNLDVDLTAPQIVKRYGYPFEDYEIKTEDGYILSLFRIPHDGKANKSKRQPVVLQHGIISSAATWLIEGENSLAFFLVNNGYDVWLANFRGSTYSTGHANLEITERQYWNFSFHEVGIYDLPAYIEFISKTTGKSNEAIIYIGHSMGTSVAFIYASLKREHAARYLKKIIALSPVAYLKNVQGILPVLAQYSDILTISLERLGFFGIGQYINLQKILAKNTCNTYPIMIFCQVFISLWTGLAMEQIKPEIFPIMTGHLPTGTSVKSLHHFGQIMLNHGRFQLYDYGISQNMALYNSTIPPEYPVEKISVPTHLFVGSKDFIAVYEDAKFLYDKLRCNKSIHIFEMSHNDFFFGRYFDSFYETLLQVMMSP